MKTSPTDRKRHEAGFTLVELLVVMTLIGLAAAVAVLAIPDAGGTLSAEAERFAARAAAARDQAIVENRPASLTLDGQGYAIARRTRDGWQEVARAQWSEGTSAEVSGEGRTVLDPTGLAEPLHVTLRRGDARIAVEIGHDGQATIRR